jgi:hypothetical protein
MVVMAGCGSELFKDRRDLELQMTLPLPPDVPLPSQAVETEQEERALCRMSVFGKFGSTWCRSCEIHVRMCGMFVLCTSIQICVCVFMLICHRARVHKIGFSLSTLLLLLMLMMICCA